jgi:hypothetical protein
MNLNLRKLFTLFGLAIALVGLLPTAAAQNNAPTAEEQILLERVIAATNEIDAFESFILSEDYSGSQQIIVTQNGVELQNATETEERIGTTVVIGGNNPNGSNVTRVAVRVTNGEETVFEVTATGKFIYAEDKLYGRADITEGGAGLIFPEEFTEIVDAKTNVFSEYFPTDSFMNWVLGEDNELVVFNDLEFLTQNYASITTAKAEINGEQVESIELQFKGDGLSNVVLATPNLGENTPFFKTLDEDDSATFVFFFSEDSMPIGFRSVMDLTISDIPLSEIDPTQQEDISVSVMVSLTTEFLYSRINEEMEPITAPE